MTDYPRQRGPLQLLRRYAFVWKWLHADVRPICCRHALKCVEAPSPMANLTMVSRFLFSGNSTPVRAFHCCSVTGIRARSSFSSSCVKSEEDAGSRLVDYDNYRRSLYGDITHRALLVDAVGTLVVPSQPMAQVATPWWTKGGEKTATKTSKKSIKIYRQFGEKYGVVYSEKEILYRYRKAYEQPWSKSSLRYVNDGRPFWQHIVSSSTGCSNSQYFEELYHYYTTNEAWHLCDPEAEHVFKSIRNAGVKLAVVSNFDTRLRPLLQALNCEHWFDALAVSAEIAAEKPNPTIFLKACELLGVKPEEAVHVGDDRRNDIWGARDVGCDAWLWGSDVHSFREIAERIGVEV